MRGYIESVTSSHASGWAEWNGEAPSHVLAQLNGEILGVALASEIRADLQYAAQKEGLLAGGFFLVLNRALTAEEQERIEILIVGAQHPLLRLPTLKRPSLPVFPVFVVGSPRSGTSILTRALQAAGYAGYREGNFLSLIQAFDFRVQTHFKSFGSNNENVLTAHIHPETLILRVAGVLRDTVERLYRNEPWLDKTGNPEMIEAIPLLRALWPDSVFIFAKRRALENIVSRQQKFPGKSFEYHCADWTRNMNTWRQIRMSEPGLKYIEIDQRDIAEQPETTAGMIADFLKMPSDSADLMTGIFTSERPQETAAGTASRTLSVDQTGWGLDQKVIFRQRCSAEMHAYGYTEDRSYRRSLPEA